MNQFYFFLLIIHTIISSLLIIPASSFLKISDHFLWVLRLPVHLRHLFLLHSTGTVLHVHYVPGLMSVPPSVTTLPGQGRSAVISSTVRWTWGFFLCNEPLLCQRKGWECEWQRPPLAEGQTVVNCPLMNQSVTAGWPHTPQGNTAHYFSVFYCNDFPFNIYTFAISSKTPGRSHLRMNFEDFWSHLSYSEMEDKDVWMTHWFMTFVLCVSCNTSTYINNRIGCLPMIYMTINC